MASKRTTVQRGISNWSIRLRTVFELFRGLQDQSDRQLNFLPGQVIKPLKGVLNIRPPKQFL
jgi:hypothetical protein